MSSWERGRQVFEQVGAGPAGELTGYPRPSMGVREGKEGRLLPCFFLLSTWQDGAAISLRHGGEAGLGQSQELLWGQCGCARFLSQGYENRFKQLFSARDDFASPTHVIVWRHFGCQLKKGYCWHLVGRGGGAALSAAHKIRIPPQRGVVQP